MSARGRSSSSTTAAGRARGLRARGRRSSRRCGGGGIARWRASGRWGPAGGTHTGIERPGAPCADPVRLTDLVRPASNPRNPVGRPGRSEGEDTMETIEVAYAVEGSAVGPLVLAATPAGLVRVAYADGGAN